MNRQKIFNRMGYPGQLGRLGDMIAQAAQSFPEFEAELADLAAELDKKVDAVEGKGLSANDFDDDYKRMLDERWQQEQEAAGGETEPGEEKARLKSDRFSIIELEN